MLNRDRRKGLKVTSVLPQHTHSYQPCFPGVNVHASIYSPVLLPAVWNYHSIISIALFLCSAAPFVLIRAITSLSLYLPAITSFHFPVWKPSKSRCFWTLLFRIEDHLSFLLLLLSLYLPWITPTDLTEKAAEIKSISFSFFSVLNMKSSN